MPELYHGSCGAIHESPLRRTSSDIIAAMLSVRNGIAAVVVLLALIGAFLWARSTPASGPAGDGTKTVEGIDIQQPTPGPSEITAADNGKAFTYRVGARFTVILDATLYPENALSCAPPSSGVVRPTNSAKEVRAPLYARTFEVIKTGTCTMTDTTFIAAIIAE